VRRFRNIIFALAAFVWLPVSAHCQLETVPGFEFLRCASESQSSQGHCADSGCCSAEKSQYKSEQVRVSLATLDLTPVPPTPSLVLTASLPDEVCVGVLTAAPPQLLKSRHFLSRTALPARAPSIAS
jgi:hypothetical protein